MADQLRRMLGLGVALLLLPAWAGAQEAASITGTVRSEAGVPLALATISIEGLGLGATSRDDGTYTITVPAARITSAPVTITARLIGYTPRSAQVALRAGTITQDFALAANPLRLSEVVVTGAGTETTREKLGTVINTVD